MKLLTFREHGKLRPGVLCDDDQVLDIIAAAAALEPAHADHLIDIRTIISSKDALATVARLQSAATDGASEWLRPQTTLELAAPVPNPPKLLALAGNYRAHIEEGGQAYSDLDGVTPRIFMKPPSTTIIGPGDDICIPSIAQAIDWEGELAVVMGKRSKNLTAEDALATVAGYTIMNDVSERKLKIRNRRENRERDKFFDWLNGKWFDTSAPMGPYLVTKDEVPDPQCLDIKTRVNGELKQNSNTGQMIFSVAEIISYISTFMTLEPGDIISTGTVAGVGASSGTFLDEGDEVEVEIDTLGTLHNRVSRETP